MLLDQIISALELTCFILLIEFYSHSVGVRSVTIKNVSPLIERSRNLKHHRSRDMKDHVTQKLLYKKDQGDVS